MNEIEPCPFPDCESTETFADWHDEEGVWQVHCRKCGAAGPTSDLNDGGDDAVELWNALGRLLRKDIEYRATYGPDADQD